MFPNSDLQIVQNTAAELVAFDPPYYGFGVAFLIAGVVCALLVVFVTFKVGWQYVYLVGYLLAGLFILGGAAAITSDSYFRFSRADGQLTITKKILGQQLDSDRIPLANIVSAEIETSKGTRRIVLVQQAGGIYPLTSSTDRSGQYEIKTAINAFLHAPNP